MEITVHRDNLDMYTSYEYNGKLIEWDSYEIKWEQWDLVFMKYNLIY